MGEWKPAGLPAGFSHETTRKEKHMGMSPVPTGTRISQEFGAFPGGYNPPAGHTGRDYATAVGTPFVAPADGIVRWASNGSFLPGGPNDWAVRWYFDKGYPGNLFVMEVPEWGALFAVAHCLDFSVKVGDRVRKGQTVGRTGNTGTATTGPHAHVEVIPLSYAWGNGTYGRVHPGPYLTEPHRPTLGAVTPPKVTKNRVLDGVDVSAYQPADIVRRISAGFVIVKTTEGAAWTSDRWKAQLADARRLGKKVGVYHYAHPGLNSSDAEADFFVNTVKKAGMDSPDLVFFLDWEEAAFYGYTAWARDFMARVDKLTGKTTGLYANTAGLVGGAWSAKDKARPLWRAYPVLQGTGYATSFHLPAPPAGWANLVMDQYSFYGRLPGYAADLDLNVYYGGLPAWGATGSTTTEKEWDEVATKNDLKEALNEVLADAKVLDRIADRVLDRRIELVGTKADGTKITGTTSLRQEASWGTFRGFRDREILAGVNLLQVAVQPSVLGEVLREVLEQEEVHVITETIVETNDGAEPAGSSAVKEA
jgi:GH25 family lysozyme M1 (1,4-beta-N-acetylmuramidase)